MDERSGLRGSIQGRAAVTGEAAGRGTNGVTPHIGENGNWYIADWDTGVPATGPQGEQGKPGHTPVRGTDYWTAQDRAEMLAQITVAPEEALAMLIECGVVAPLATNGAIITDGTGKILVL